MRPRAPARTPVNNLRSRKRQLFRRVSVSFAVAPAKRNRQPQVLHASRRRCLRFAGSGAGAALSPVQDTRIAASPACIRRRDLRREEQENAMTADTTHGPAALREILRFFADSGVDEALDEVAADRFAPAAQAGPRRAAAPGRPAGEHRSSPGAPAPQVPPADGEERSSALPDMAAAEALPAARPQTASVPDEAQAARARELARSAASLEELREILADFDGCNLKFTAKSLVFADGNPDADLMLVGEAPGRDEDIEGLPFVGRSGQLLDRMLTAIGRDRTSAYIANVIPWRPPGNRTPTPLETEICRPFIERQIELAQPKVLVNLGGPSAKTLLHTTEGILRLRGNWRVHVTASGIAIPAMPTLHPAYLLRNPAHKKLAWRDFLEVKAKLRELA
jgi:DNA polymerase